MSSIVDVALVAHTSPHGRRRRRAMNIIFDELEIQRRFRNGPAVFPPRSPRRRPGRQLRPARRREEEVTNISEVGVVEREQTPGH